MYQDVPVNVFIVGNYLSREYLSKLQCIDTKPYYVSITNDAWKRYTKKVLEEPSPGWKQIWEAFLALQ